jgi:hypothetical protein
MKKKLDCVEMKRKAQERIAKQTRGMSREEELEYFNKGAAKFWQEIEALRNRKRRKTFAQPKRRVVELVHSTR